MPRVLDVVRIQLVHWPALLGYPLLALAAMPLLGWGIDVSNGETARGAHEIYLLPMLLGAIASAHLQTMTQVFPFTLGLGVTRRAFAAATALVVLGQALLLGLGLVAFDIVERLTGGWGRETRIFGLDVLGHGNPLALWLVYSGPLVAVSAIGVLAGVVFQRWRHTGIYLTIFGSVVLLVAMGALAKTQNWWPSIGSFLGGQPSLTLFTAYPLVFALALGGAAWLVLRRATA
ncbi:MULTISPECIES: hypothetical protein [unclassified Parafrankia]|uniref:hypothetical protein n=1 Tax=unclassified Parafrankia TaxID=2994368 RepID=UPI000DA4CFBE|nr:MULTISPECIES: hypothetical protein [unclassified Parafrankia]TCJ32461.1 hypothetical protein E0504_42660 [Parafrankia sp. BMG5.11]SQE00314.1 putative secreted protein [Parafrankia sp. Ea1.12]